MTTAERDIELPLLRDTHGLRTTRQILIDGKVVCRISVQPPSDDRLTALGKKESATLTMPEEGVTFQTLGVQVSPMLEPEEVDRYVDAIPRLIGVTGLAVALVACYDPDSMVGWDEFHVTRPEEAGPWDAESLNGLLNAVQIALTYEVSLPIFDTHTLPS